MAKPQNNNLLITIEVRKILKDKLNRLDVNVHGLRFYTD
jgi:hypothetical protein